MKRDNKDFAIGLTVLLCALAGLVFTAVWKVSVSRSYQVSGKLVDRVETSQRVIALTLDDGPTPGYTGKILEILQEHGVKATFYLVGQDIVRNPAETRAIIAAGHEIGNHSFSHRRMVFISRADVVSEVEKTESAIRAAGYAAPLTFRPPYGKKLLELPRYLSARGTTSVTWDVEPESSPAVAADAGKIVAHVVNEVRPGSIVLMHAMFASRGESLKALPQVIEKLKQQGYAFVTVSELLKQERTRPGSAP